MKQVLRKYVFDAYSYRIWWLPLPAAKFCSVLTTLSGIIKAGILMLGFHDFNIKGKLSCCRADFFSHKFLIFIKFEYYS